MLNFLKHIMSFFAQTTQASESEHDLDELSLKRLATCDPRLQKIVMKVSLSYKLRVLEGHRGKAAQDEAYKKGLSKLKWPNSKHNSSPALAFDACPLPIKWDANSNFYYFAGFVMATALEMGYELRFGGDWDGDKDCTDQNFHDLVHFEIKEA